MKKLLNLFLILTLLFSTPAFAAISANTVWEIRTTGSDNNGGGFDSTLAGAGVDYSQQNASQLSVNDLTSSGAGSTTIASAAAGFTSNMVGNVIYIRSGTNFNAGRYQIITFTDTGHVILDRTATPAGAGSVGVGEVGGACILIDATNFEGALVAGNTVHIKSGTYNFGSSFTGPAGAGGPICSFIGYTSSRNDATTGSNRPVMNLAANAFISGTSNLWKNLIFTTSQASGIQGSADGEFLNCKIISTNATATNAAANISNGCRLIDCEISNGAGIGILGAQNHLIQGCYIHGCTTGLRFSSTVNTIINNIIAHCSTGAFFPANLTKTKFINNTFYGDSTPLGTGIDSTTATAMVTGTFLNNIFYGYATAVNWQTTKVENLWDYNDFYNNTTNRTNVTAGTHDLAVDPQFTNASGTLIEDGEDAWNEQVISNVTASLEGTVKQVGSGSAKFDVAAGFTTGNIGSEAISSTDMSNYNGLHMWVRSSVTLAAGDWQVVLDDSANIASPVVTYNLPPMTANTWYKVYLGNVSLSSATAIISIGLKQAVDKGAMLFYIDNVTAANNNYSIGTNLKAAGYPGYQAGFTSTYVDVGGVQRQESSSSSTDLLGVVQ